MVWTSSHDVAHGHTNTVTLINWNMSPHHPRCNKAVCRMCSLFLVSMLGRRMLWREVRKSNTVLKGVELEGSLCRGVRPR